ncbi:copper resistance CopC family protein [Rubrobacter marinus]|uniref:copper resistance CopC family protein n=1 Tax=Rubrobacter marinus TaxID=2653852 RepID=UPI00140A2301|nr:copper resistance protein CopC [Rubrobacter marinus]
MTVVAAVPALAHAELESAAPAEGESLEQAPSEVRLSFGEPVEAAFNPVEVYDSGGNRVDGDDGRSDPNDARVVVASLREELPAGSYTVEWTVTSADGDPVSGEYSFDVAASSSQAADTTQEDQAGGAPVEPEEAASRSGGEGSTETGGFGSGTLYAALALGVVVLLGLSLRGRGR